MTTIKLRRGLAATFATNNPVLQAGEPAFATDTGVLKIGDGTTAYNSLPSIGASPDLSNYVQKTDYASTASAGVIKVDGSTITVSADGTISAASSGGAQIDDNNASTTTVYSSTKCNNTYFQNANTNNITQVNYFQNTQNFNIPSRIAPMSTNSEIVRFNKDGSITGTISGRWDGSRPIINFRSGYSYGGAVIVGGTVNDRVFFSGDLVPRWYPAASSSQAVGTMQQGNMIAYSGSFNSNDFTVTEASDGRSLSIGLNNVVKSSTITNMVKLTQAEYDALTTKDPNTFYVIVAASS